jgi:hypothetical protein
LNGKDLQIISPTVDAVEELLVVILATASLILAKIITVNSFENYLPKTSMIVQKVNSWI